MDPPAAEGDKDPFMAPCTRQSRAPPHGLPNGGGGGGSAPPPPSSWLEIRLFYVRISPCAPDAVPPHLTLSHLRREIGAALEINGSRVPPSEPTSIPLRRDRLDSSEVTYVSTDGVRIAGAVEFEVLDERGSLVLCGSIERMDAPWSNGAIVHHTDKKDSKAGWSMDCCSAASNGSSAFLQPKMGISSPSIEVYVAGCVAGFPLILTQTIQLSPRRKVGRPGNLDSIPEEKDTSSMTERRSDDEGSHLGMISLSSDTEREIDDYSSDLKVGRYYPEGWYADEDGQLTWFNAGVRVGVGIGLGMCVGLGIGVGLLMRSYQATTRGFRRRFF